ncbi:UDP-2,4-diacetamido-2,4,6-trideoxy-beta-L-altropyranose hydrolase [Metapseudomonas otitidis]|uniref:UDP-2,4-diacetamido-2,4, 6-trideoxy-beta-L-altropyranose hydrolase n=1 Tax=Metapseudomonas otitidis TaxID=319939 RepID=UPI0013F5AE9B|nr:UDP-2,4-diacetamido-2,4,6-trideoxy-beta-L-altropyranose hydrolase [Pseudomonas otitidis]
MQVLFRVDASPVMGSGHLMRCLTLARELYEQGAGLTFACRDLPAAPLALVSSDYALLRLPASAADETAACTAEARIDNRADAEALHGLLGERHFDWCVVDHYGLDAEWHGLARRHASRVMVLDDLANRPLDCDLLLDPGLHAEPHARYASHLTCSATTLFGPSYALLREEFLRAREGIAPRAGELKRLLVFFTGGDDQGETLKALQALADWRPQLQVDVVIGLGHGDHKVLERLCTAQGWHLHCQIDYMARLMAEADLAIGAAGSSSWERCALGLPALVVVLAENQRELARGLDRLGLAVDLGEHAEVSAADYRRVLEGLDAERLRGMSRRAWDQVDGLGAARVGRALMDATVGS